MDKKQEDEIGKEGSAYARYGGMGFQMIAIIGIFTFAGYKIDEAAHHPVKWVTALLSLIGVVISIYLIIVSLKK